jgi:thiol-disulfide isomerase/thioredoxin
MAGGALETKAGDQRAFEIEAGGVRNMQEKRTPGCLLVFAIGLLGSRTALATENNYFRAELRGQGVAIPFILELAMGKPPIIWNGSEKIEALIIRNPTRSSTSRVTIHFLEYGSMIEAHEQPDHSLVGRWKKPTNRDEITSLDFLAIPLASSEKHLRFPPNFKVSLEIEKPTTVDGRWAVKFSSDESPAIGVFKESGDKTVEGTFLTTTGDYRFLAGSYEHGLLRLSCFDGSHAFLFHARMQADGTLQGDFWSGAKWHETWTAKRDDKAALPDGFGLTKINSKARLKELKFPDLDGKERSFAEPGLLGKATIVEIFGSWCPNCHDAAELLVELEKKYGPRGLKVVGLAFESGDTERDVRQVKRYLERHKATYPVLLAGVRDRKKASAALQVVEELKSYPTFLFVDADGEVRSVYSGFSGPATGEEYTKLRRQFESAIEKLLATGG